MKRGPDIADRILAHARGEGVDPASVRTVAGNPFLPDRAKKPVASTVLILDGANMTVEELSPLIGKRLVKITAERYDVTFTFNDGSSAKFADGGNGLEFLFVGKDKDQQAKK